QPATTGFVVQGAAERFVLLRAIGPGLIPWEVSDPLVDPQLRLYNQDGEEIGLNDDWHEIEDTTAVTTTATAVGAIALADDNEDSAILALLEPGVYTATVQGSDPSAEGVVLLELYDADEFGLDWSNLENVSTLGQP